MAWRSRRARAYCPPGGEQKTIASPSRADRRARRQIVAAPALLRRVSPTDSCEREPARLAALRLGPRRARAHSRRSAWSARSPRTATSRSRCTAGTARCRGGPGRSVLARRDRFVASGHRRARRSRDCFRSRAVAVGASAQKPAARPKRQSDPGGCWLSLAEGEQAPCFPRGAGLPGPAVRNPDAGGKERSRCYGVEPAKRPRARQFVGLCVVVGDQMRSKASWSSGSSQHAAMRFWRISYRATVDQRCSVPPMVATPSVKAAT
jgi:hypothetical protein